VGKKGMVRGGGKWGIIRGGKREEGLGVGKGGRVRMGEWGGLSLGKRLEWENGKG
jgi:hypothetical protein